VRSILGRTFVQKALAKNAGLDSVEIGEIVDARPDFVLSHDNTADISGKFLSIGTPKVWDPQRIVIVLDHCVPAATEKYAKNHKIIRDFVRSQDIVNFYDINSGVCHQVLPEKGHALPGQLILGADSHTTTYGAFGAFSAGVGRSEVAAIYATGRLWLRVPETIRVTINGKLPPLIAPKDIILHIIGQLGADAAVYKAVQFDGEAVDAMSVGGRMTLCNMAAEMGAKNAYLAPDHKVFDWLSGRSSVKYEVLVSDKDAQYEAVYDFDVSDLSPQVACPHTVDNVRPVNDLKDIEVNQVLIGTCTNGRLEDLEEAAQILEGRHISRSVRLLVFPASTEVYKNAIKRGVIEALSESGAVIMNPGCGPCLGAHEGALAPGEVCLSTANRNFKGRMGCKDAQVYLSSPATAAATALTGIITDPRVT
jgi:3-isopropylmalate/(R)-2-methylmalate dehydratase large subunit